MREQVFSKGVKILYIVGSEYCGYYCENPRCCAGNVSSSVITRLSRKASVLCPKDHIFDSSKSATYKKNGQGIKISYYGEYNVTGFLGEDTVSLGAMGTDQLVIPKTSFAQINKIDDWFYDFPYDGILGLGFTSLAAGNVVPPFVSSSTVVKKTFQINAVNQGLVDHPVFTIFLEEQGANLNNIAGGAITYGGLDTTNCGPLIAYQPLSSATYWQFQMQGVSAKANGVTYSNSQGWQVISATTYGFIYGPSAILDDLVASIGGYVDNE